MEHTDFHEITHPARMNMEVVHKLTGWNNQKDI
jgi:hypothetical protein